MTAAAAYRLRLAVSIALAVIATLLALVLASALSAPGATWADKVPLVSVTEENAVAAAQERPADYSAAERWTRETLALKPGEAAAWARLAWIAAERGDRAAMHDALVRSYAVAPYGPDITAWRLRFVYDRWGELTPEIRTLASAELAVTARYRGGTARVAFEALEDPWARIVFDATVRRAQSETP